MLRLNSKGFTLIELLIVVAIIGILTAIALPGYREHTMKANRTDAFTALNEIMHAQERFAAENGTYTKLLKTDLGYSANDTIDSSEGLYKISADECASDIDIEDCVLLTAEAQAPQDNDKNGNNGDISLSSRGEKVGW